VRHKRMLGASRRLISTCQSSAAVTVIRTMGAVATDAKRKILRIGTHSGTFHCDEALGCFLLQQASICAGAPPPPLPPGARIGPASQLSALAQSSGTEVLTAHLQTAQYKGAEVVRSRNPEVLKDLDVVIDVGATYEPGASLSVRLTPYLSHNNTRRATPFTAVIQT